jgi:hypothetical protein
MTFVAKEDGDFDTHCSVAFVPEREILSRAEFVRQDNAVEYYVSVPLLRCNDFPRALTWRLCAAGYRRIEHGRLLTWKTAKPGMPNIHSRNSQFSVRAAHQRGAIQR